MNTLKHQGNQQYGRTAIPLVVATLLRNWRIRHATGREVTPLVKGTMRPSPLSMMVTRRTAAFAFPDSS